MPADPKEEYGRGMREGSETCLLGCKTHALSWAEEEPKKVPADPKEEMWGGMGEGSRSVFFEVVKNTLSVGQMR